MDRRSSPAMTSCETHGLFGSNRFFQSLPAIRVVVLQGRRLRRVRGDALRVAGLEHEGHGAGHFTGFSSLLLA